MEHTVSAEHLAYAAQWLGSKMLCTSPNQVLLESDHTFLDRFTIHELNRNVDVNWVSQMKVEVLKTIMSKECMTLTLAIDKRMIATAIAEPENEDQGGFKAIILDGQHRYEAMRQLLREMPALEFNIWLVVYVVSNDAEILSRLETLNRRRNFSQSDNDKIAVTQRFLEAFEHYSNREGESMSTKRCIVKVRKSPILKSPKFVSAHRMTTTAQFIEKLAQVSTQYKRMWDAYAEKVPKSVLHDVVKKTKLHQLVDEHANWLNEV